MSIAKVNYDTHVQRFNMHELLTPCYPEQSLPAIETTSYRVFMSTRGRTGVSTTGVPCLCN